MVATLLPSADDQLNGPTSYELQIQRDERPNGSPKIEDDPEKGDALSTREHS
jgi:hypothetical protein